MRLYLPPILPIPLNKTPLRRERPPPVESRDPGVYFARHRKNLWVYFSGKAVRQGRTILQDGRHKRYGEWLLIN